MTLGKKTTGAVAGAVVATLLLGTKPAMGQVPLLKDPGGWQLTTDGRVNTFISIANGTGLPDQPDFVGAGTADTQDSTNGLHSTRVRGGFIPNILGFTLQKEISPNFKVSTRVALWMNIGGSRTKNISALVDPRELYGKVEGKWGSFLAGSALALFGRGGILVDAQIAHNYGLGYPCSIKDASGGACGMVAFGAPFPGFEPGLVYSTPSMGGLQVSLGVYDPATIGNATLNRAPLPRIEGELKFDFKDKFRVFTSGFWQVLEGTVSALDPATGMTYLKNLHTNAWGAQAGAMATFGPVMLGGAAFQGAGFSPITYVDEHQIAADSSGVLRKSRGAFGLLAVLINAANMKVAGGMGVLQINKNQNDTGAIGPAGEAANPRLLRQNLGTTVGIYQTTGPVHFALEYFRAQHTWYDRGVPNPADPTLIDVVTPRQVVNFVNAGMTIAW